MPGTVASLYLTAARFRRQKLQFFQYLECRDKLLVISQSIIGRVDRGSCDVCGHFVRGFVFNPLKAKFRLERWYFVL